MLKVGLVGIGFMGRGHLEQYIRLMGEGAPVELVALCDVDPKKFETGAAQGGNLGSLGIQLIKLRPLHVHLLGRVTKEVVQNLQG